MIHDSVQFAQAHDASVGDVRHMGMSHDGQKVVLARGVDVDVTLHQHVVVAVHVVERLDVRVVLRVESEKISFIHLGHTLGRARQAVVVEVEPQHIHDLAELGFNFRHLLLVAQRKRVGFEGVWADVPTWSSPMTSS